MSSVLFDCTQFITFDTEGDEASIRQVLSDFETLGFQVVGGEDIESRKLEYLTEYLSSTTVELFDQNFMGVLLEDWRDATEVPARVEHFAEVVAQLARSGAVWNLRLILVSDAPLERDHIVRRRVGVGGIIDAFLLMPIHLSRVLVNILVVEIEADS